MAENKCYLLEHLSLGQEVAHEENEGRMEKRVDLEYFIVTILRITGAWW